MTTTAADSPQTDSPARLNPAALSVDELARLLSAAGSRLVTPEQIQADIEAGAPRPLAAQLTDLRESIVVEGAGHWVQQEAPDVVSEALVGFLRGAA